MNILKTVTTTTGNQAMNDEISDLLAEQRQTIELLKKLRNTLDLMDKSNQVITYKLEKVLGDRDFQTAYNETMCWIPPHSFVVRWFDVLDIFSY